jgi:integrase
MSEKSFEDNIKQKFKEKGIADSSVKIYLRCLRKLNGGDEIKNFDFLKKKNEIEKYLKDFSDNTKRSYYISICSTLKLFENSKNKTINKLYNDWVSKMNEQNEKLKAVIADGGSSKQKENMISWDEVKTIFNKLKEKIEDNVYKKPISRSQYSDLMKVLILGLYVLQIPRRSQDYFMMKMFNHPITIDKNMNYLDIQHKKFIFQNYKTAKVYGDEDVEINPELMSIIKKYIAVHPQIKKGVKQYEVDFLCTYDGKEFKNNTITKILNSVFAPKKISVSMLRHSFISSNKNSGVLKEIKKEAEAMGHTVETHLNYLIENDKEQEKPKKKIMVKF